MDDNITKSEILRKMDAYVVAPLQMKNKKRLASIIQKTANLLPYTILHYGYNIRIKRKIKSINEKVMSYDLTKQIPLFTGVEIETINKCNWICPFCPVNVHNDPRKHITMTDDLFKKIISELKNLNYTGVLSLSSNNEPFLDKSIIERAKYAKDRLPTANLRLWTNATLLTIDKYVDIMQYLDIIKIDNYNDNNELNPNVKVISDYVKNHPELKPKTYIMMRLQNEIISSRGGQAPNKPEIDQKVTLNASCNLPFGSLIIRPDGKVSLCCNDALGVYTLGDVSIQSLTDVWNSEIHLNILLELQKNGRKNLELCKNCDFGCYN